IPPTPPPLSIPVRVVDPVPPRRTASVEDEVRAVPPLFATTILSPVNEVAFVPPLAMLNVPPERTPLDTLTAPSERPVRLMVPVAVRPATERLPESRPLPCTERSREGEVVPIPTNPPLVTIRFVAVEEPMTNEGPEMPLGFTESSPQGEVVLIPTLPLFNIVRAAGELVAY